MPINNNQQQEAELPFSEDLLNAYFASKVQISNDDRDKVDDYIENAIDTILNHCSEIDDQISVTPIKVGSSYSRLKINRPDEFDVLVLFNITDQEWTDEPAPRCTFRLQHRIKGNILYEDTKRLPDGLETYELCNTRRNLPSPDLGYYSLEDNDTEFSYQGFIVPFLVKVHFRKVLHQAIDRFNKSGETSESCKMVRAVHGPTNTVTFTVHNFGKISVDFTPCIRMREFSPDTPWPSQATERWLSAAKIRRIKNKGVYFIAKKNYHWFVSYAKNERELVEGIDADGGCRKKCHRFMKALNEDSWFITVPHRKTPLSSYHLKNIWLTNCEQLPASHHWTQDKVLSRIRAILAQLEQATRNGRLVMYFDSDINLMEDMDLKELRQLAVKIRDFLDNDQQALMSVVKKYENSYRG